VNALEAKDEYTRGHSERVAFWSLLIADLLGLSPKDKEQIHRGALLHDIGKIGLRIDLLARAGKLTSEEWEEVKIHPVVGKKILEPIEFLSPVMPIILYHHERWDGKGYPFGLSGTEIPLFARIVAIADAFEVMITDRPYRPALSLSEAKQELRRCAGKQFDPDIVSSFLNYLEPYRETQDLPQPSLGENPVFFILKDEKKGEVR
jgi:putative nucleotidyltransferase with HDIG domain